MESPIANHTSSFILATKNASLYLLATILLMLIGIVSLFYRQHTNQTLIDYQVDRISELKQTISDQKTQLEKYKNLNSIDSSLINRLKDKNIDGTIYSFIGDESSLSESLFIRSLQFGYYQNDNFIPVDKSINYWITSIIQPNTLSYWYQASNNQFFTVEKINQDYGRRNFQLVIKHQLGNNSQINQANILYSFNAGIFGFTSIIDYDEPSKTIILKTASGDGCGGSGVIWTLDSNTLRHDVQEFGSGCGINEKTPSFIGIYNHQLVFGIYQSNNNLPIPDQFELVQLMLINPINHQRQTISKTDLLYDQIYNQATYPKY